MNLTRGQKKKIKRLRRIELRQPSEGVVMWMGKNQSPIVQLRRR